MPDGAAFLTNPVRLLAETAAAITDPPPPIDYLAWAKANVRFGPESQFPGPYNDALFPFFRRPLEVLAPDHLARVIVFMKSAQLGGTVLAQIFLGGSLDLDPGPFLYTHPTESNAARWAKQKWKAMLRQTTCLSSLFAATTSRDATNSTLYQERRDGRGFVQISGANSAASLAMMSVPRQVQDDLGKWELNNAGDPETQADSRSQAFEWAKIFKCGTPLLEDSCRITRNFKASTQEHWHVPCPQCGHEQPLEWENMLATLDEAHPGRVHFTCGDCGFPIEEKHRAEIVGRGRWVAHNPGASIVGFYLWGAYAPLMSWQRIAERWIASKGDPAKEQTFINDVVGRAYRQAGEAPPWEALRDRAQESQATIGLIPPGALMLALGVDCQGDRVEWHLVGHGRELRRWPIDYGVIDGHISEASTLAALDKLLERRWRDSIGNDRPADILAIDGNVWTEDVFAWVRRHPQGRVIMVRGVASDHAPFLAAVKRERDARGRAKKYSRRFFNVGVSPMKMSLYKFLQKPDPLARGYVGLPRGFEDEYYRQLTAERRTAVRRKDGFVAHQWTKDPGQANEVLDTMLYAEAGAIRLGWRSWPDYRWDQLQAEREAPAPERQLDLEEPKVAAAAAPPPAAAASRGRGVRGHVGA